MPLLYFFVLLPLVIYARAVSFLPTREKIPLDNSSHLRPDVDVAMSPKRLEPSLKSGNMTQRKSDGKLPFYVPSTDSSRPLVKRQRSYNFSTQEVNDISYSKNHGRSQNGVACSPLNTIFDVGFYDGTDSIAYLAGGYCVVGVEADPDLIAQALHKFAVWIATGQLQMVNVALSPRGEASRWTAFYRSKCSKEWNSFYESVGCRSCVPPHAIDYSACDKLQVVATDCASIFTTFGIPHYLKLDIEGAETGCFAALESYTSDQLPPYVSAEITNVEYIDNLYRLGYQSFKLVRQDRLASATGSQSGPWGENALDCRVGPAWRSYAQARQEMIAIMSKSMDISDPCPGGIQSIHGETNPKGSSMWYDVHASRAAPVAR
jgi:FkbM family methyltransferase|mmetsp:Transcript_35142/g.54597  ORF Transcript_35142/g.54597 Transcript_35142/m.54597 type:complete len:376 (+) Transcript_35142:89-1216(+)